MILWPRLKLLNRQMGVLVSERSSQGGQQFFQVARGPKSGRGAQRSHKLRHKSGGSVILCDVQTVFMHSFSLCTCAIDVVSMWTRLLHWTMNTSYLHQGSIHPLFLAYITYFRAFFWLEVVILRARRSWYGTIEQRWWNTAKYICDLRIWRGQLTILWKHCSSKETSVNLDDISSTSLQKLIVVNDHLSSHFVYCVSTSKLIQGLMHSLINLTIIFSEVTEAGSTERFTFNPGRQGHCSVQVPWSLINLF